jgi:hypothetical protein
MTVRHVKGGGAYTCACGSWLHHWEKFSGEPLPRFCCVENCREKPEMGAHVSKEYSRDANSYVIPMCKTHAAEKHKCFHVGFSATFVSAEPTMMCGK